MLPTDLHSRWRGLLHIDHRLHSSLLALNLRTSPQSLQNDPPQQPAVGGRPGASSPLSGRELHTPNAYVVTHVRTHVCAHANAHVHAEKMAGLLRATHAASKSAVQMAVHKLISYKGGYAAHTQQSCMQHVRNMCTARLRHRSTNCATDTQCTYNRLSRCLE